MKRFVDTNVFVYALTGHPKFGETARTILQRIEAGETALTSTLVRVKAYNLEGSVGENLLECGFNFALFAHSL